MSTSMNVSYLNTSAQSSNRPANVLLVDDARVMRATIQAMLEKQGYSVLVAENGEDALINLNEHCDHIDAVILDREMPGLNGMDIVKRMKGNVLWSDIPIIMFTGTGAPEKIQEGIDAGVFYYLVKPADSAVLKSVIDSAVRERNQKKILISEIGRHGMALKGMTACQLALHTLTEIEDAAAMLACCFPSPERVADGLLELMVNGLEHGNLGISYQEKKQLLSENRWRQEIDARARLPQYGDKVLNVAYQRKGDSHLLQITDDGEGFDWKKFWHINPARATASHGRGIARARLISFDGLSYNDKGNSVTVMVSSEPMTRSYAW